MLHLPPPLIKICFAEDKDKDGTMDEVEEHDVVAEVVAVPAHAVGRRVDAQLDVARRLRRERAREQVRLVVRADHLVDVAVARLVQDVIGGHGSTPARALRRRCGTACTR